jgi:hypothetical protein
LGEIRNKIARKSKLGDQLIKGQIEKFTTKNLFENFAYEFGDLIC